jgi:hypothetical protein
MRFNETRACQCVRLLETEVVQNRWGDNGEVLDDHGHEEGVQQRIQPRQSDCRSTLLGWRLYRMGGATTAKYLMSTSVVDNYQELLALNAIENRGGAELRLMSLYPLEMVLYGRNPCRICIVGTDDT